MEKTVKKMLKTGYGLGLLSLNEGRKVASSVKRELGLSEEESMRLAKELVRESETVSKEVLGTVQKYAEKALVRSKLVDHGELNFIKKRLKKRIDKMRHKESENLYHRLKRKIKR
ncbi:hypothetical protein J4444_01855 [Candidatus Woesearchaeota archaeon]|nr:hypothetical protein [Candidatus Woesearchaeota archaeon]